MGHRGLILGGGGFFGAFQAGAIRELGEFDSIVGVSAGALNGWALASGMPAEQLEALWLEAADTARNGFHFPRFLGDGVLDSRKLDALVESLVRDWKPRIPFGAVISQGWDCRQLLVRNENVDARVLLASCAVPVLLPAQRVNGRLSFDGGVRDACPIWAARAMGASEIVGVNVWTHLPGWWPGLGVRSGRSQSRVTIIEPTKALGPLRRAALANREEVASWIKLGRQTASSVFARQ